MSIQIGISPILSSQSFHFVPDHIANFLTRLDDTNELPILSINHTPHLVGQILALAFAFAHTNDFINGNSDLAPARHVQYQEDVYDQNHTHALPFQCLTGFGVQADPVHTFTGFVTHALPVHTLTPATPIGAPYIRFAA